MYNKVENSHDFRSTVSFTEEQVETMLKKKQRFGEMMPFAATWTDLEIIFRLLFAYLVTKPLVQ